MEDNFTLCVLNTWTDCTVSFFQVNDRHATVKGVSAFDIEFHNAGANCYCPFL
jgi:hypothetical protein